MRLLEHKLDGDLVLHEFIGKDVPAYAILSHTWAEDEVSFQELEAGTGKDKAGWKKIDFCAKLAGADGLRFIWVDTCCIDKKNAVELSEAINSMFHWYKKAARCYVYLSDVSICGQHGQSNLPWEEPFRKSRWFTRGWTLQELLAPSSVQFFSQDGKRLGDKRSLCQQIHDITGIDLAALQGSTTISQFSVDTRFRWARNRQTTREEDWAYCLLGIFNVSMPLIYGEGREKAIIRLKKEMNEAPDDMNQYTMSEDLLRRLPVANDAPFNSLAKQHEPSCLAETRIDLLRDIYHWADGQDKRPIFWLNGFAGTGKSTIARTIARTYFDQKRLGASFFFARGGGDVGNANRFVTSIAIQLASSVRGLRQELCDAISKHSDIANLSLHDQWQMLVLNPLSKVERSDHLASFVVVVDALDECDDDRNIATILQSLAATRALKTAQIKIFLTSRPEITIRHEFSNIAKVEHKDFILHNVCRPTADHDISLFLRHHLKIIAQGRYLGPQWPEEEVIKRLVQSASGLFIWAATACRFIREGRQFAAKRLETILKGSRNVVGAPEKHLDEIYVTVLQQSVSLQYSDDEKEELYLMLRHVLGTIIVLSSPLSLSSLSKLLSLPKGHINQTLEDLHSVLDIPNSESVPLRLHHPSFRDFLIDPNRCKDENLRIDEKKTHQTLYERCLQVMSTSLRDDICGFNTPGLLVAEVESSRVEQSLPKELQYACLFWVQHLRKSGTRLYDDDQVHHFLRKHLLQWLEALGWMQNIADGINAINSLKLLTKPHECPQLSEFVCDVERFVLYNRSAIVKAPFQIYCSALTFAPAMSIVRGQFKDCIPRWIRKLPNVGTNWDPLLQTLIQSDPVIDVAFSPDGKLLGSATENGTIALWDTFSETPLRTFESDSSVPVAITFSPDSKLLAMEGERVPAKLLDVTSGAELQIPNDGGYKADIIAFSPDGKLLAMATHGHFTLKVREISSGALVKTYENDDCHFYSMTFSPNGKLLAFAARFSVVVWNVDLHTISKMFNVSPKVNSVVFSSDSKMLAAAKSSCGPLLWDVVSGELLHELDSGDISGWAHGVDFSPDGKILASASSRKVKIWDVSSGTLLRELNAHFSSITAVAFSLNGKQLVSTSTDESIKLWDVSIATKPAEPDTTEDVYLVVFSPNGKLLASISVMSTVKLWDVASGAILHTLWHSNDVETIVFSPDSKLLASAGRFKGVRLWNTNSGTALQTVGDRVRKVMTFSPNGKLLAVATREGTIQIWDAMSGASLQTLDGYSSIVKTVVFKVTSLAYSHFGSSDTFPVAFITRVTNTIGIEGLASDGRIVGSIGYSDESEMIRSYIMTEAESIRSWALARIDHHLRSVRALAFSPDGEILASALGDGTVKLWDTNHLGSMLKVLDGEHLKRVNAIRFSATGMQLVSASEDTIKIWNVNSGTALQTLVGYSGSETDIPAISPDCSLVASSFDYGRWVKLWNIESGTVIHVLSLGTPHILKLSFSNDGSFLCTNRGRVRVPHDGDKAAVSSTDTHNAIFVNDQSVNWGREEILWLPYPCQPLDVDVQENVIALGCEAGRVFIFEIAY